MFYNYFNKALTPLETRNYSILFILLYLWILITSPQSRFPILGQIHFERIVMIACWVVLLLNNKIKIRFSGTSFLITAFYLLMIISHFLSPYKDYLVAQHWLSNYWKIIVLYFLVLFSINNLEDLAYLFLGIVIVFFLYQAHSWYDFLHGGSYVWQQGMKRIVGVWSEGDYGSANYFGLIALFSLPFFSYSFKLLKNKTLRFLILPYFPMAVLSIIYSGTRAAIAGLLFFLLISVRNLRGFAIIIIFLIGCVTLSTYYLPKSLKHRYFDAISLLETSKDNVDSRIDQISRDSALARVYGLIDGWKLATKKPILGYGPGSSPLARKEVNVELSNNFEYDSQMHNLYGQLLAETGVLGTLLFFSIIAMYFWQLRHVNHFEWASSKIYPYILVLQNSMLLMLFYGFASHTLYRYYWLLLFAFQGAFIDILWSRSKQCTGDRSLSAAICQAP